MWFQNRHLTLYWISNQMYVCPIMASTLNTPETFPGGLFLKEMAKIATCIR